MDDLCTACLCKGRRLYFIGETGSYHLYSQILNEIPVYNLSDVSVRVCFECRALLRRFGEFKVLVKKSYSDLLTQLHQNCPPSKSSLARPSRLSIQKAASCSYPELFVPIKEEVEVDYGVPLADVDSTSVKEECYPEHSEPEAEAFVEDVKVKKIKKKKTKKKTIKEKTKKKTKAKSKKLEEKKINTKKKAKDDSSVSSADEKLFLSDALGDTDLNDDGIDDEEDVSLDVVKKEEQLKEKKEKALSRSKSKKTDVETNEENVMQVEKPPKKANGPIPKEKNPEPEMVGDKPKCGECGKIFSSKKTYRYHLKFPLRMQNAEKKIFFKYSEESLDLALREIGDGAKIRETARKYDIPHSTIINKLKSRTPLVRKMGPPTILTPQEELLLVRWIKAMAKKGFPINKNNLAQTVYDIISNDNRPTPFKDNSPGRAWMEGFLKRHKDISQRNSENIDIARSRVTERDIRNWHSGLHNYLEAENALDILDDPDRIINCDEAGFQTNPSSGTVLGPKGMNNLYGISENSKESITVLGTFAASGKVLPPAIIYPYEIIHRDIAANINKDWSVGKSKNGWMTCKVFYGYVANTLLPALRRDGTKFPVLLLVDGHRSHISGEVSKLCIENGIILYALYPNSTRILQPADVYVFRPLKNNWRSVVQQYKLKTGTRVLTRALFAPLLEEAFKAATASTISNGFRKCGLYPFDANAIDYSRCINDKTRHEAADKPVEMGPEHLLVESLMRKERAQEFRAQVDEDWQGDSSAKELFYVWRKLRNQVQSGDIESVINALNAPKDEGLEVGSLDISAEEQQILAVPEISENVVASLANKALNKSDPSISQEKNENAEMHRLENVCPRPFVKPIECPNTDVEKNYQTEGQPHIPNPILKPIENLDPVDNQHHSETCLKDPVEPLDEKSKSKDEVSNDEPLENASDTQISIQSVQKTPSKTPTMTTPKVPVKHPVVPISPAFAAAIVWPTESPIKHGKKKSNANLPDAISSQEWIRYWEGKDKEKLDKEEKKLARAEKRKINQDLKIQKSKKKRKPVIYSESSEDDEVLSKVAERNEKSTKTREDKYEVGKYVIVKYEGEYFPGVKKARVIIKNVLHKGQNRYPCPRCARVYQWKSNLGRHLRTHKMTARQRTQAEQYIKSLGQNQNEEFEKNKTIPIEYVNCSFESENPDDDDDSQESHNDSSSLLKDVERKLKDTLESIKARNYETNTLKVTDIAAQNITRVIKIKTDDRQKCGDNLKEINSDHVSYCNETILTLKEENLTGENAEAIENQNIEDVVSDATGGNPSIKSKNNSAIDNKDANKDIPVKRNDNNKNNTSYFYIPIEDEATNSQKGRKIKIAELNRATLKIPANNNQKYLYSAGEESKSKSFKANFNCKCAKKCTEILSVAKRKAEFDRFWKIGSFEGRCAELQKCVQELHKKRCYSGSGSNRVFTRKYYLLNNEICKVAFLNTLGVSGSRVNKALLKRRNNETNDKKINTISGDQLNAMRNFISSFLNSSNYCTESGMANLPPHVKLLDLYDAYKTENRNVVSFSRFRKCFVNDFNWKPTSTLPEVKMRHISETHEIQKLVINDPNLFKSKSRKSKSLTNVESEASEIDNSGAYAIETLDQISNTSCEDREMQDNYILIVEDDTKSEDTKNNFKNVSTAVDSSSSEKYNNQMFEMETVDDESTNSDDEEVKNRLFSMQTDDETNQAVHHIGANYDVVETETTHEVNKPVTIQDLVITYSTEKEDNFDKEAPPTGLMNCSKYQEILNKPYTTGRKRKVADQNPAIRKIRANTNQDYISTAGKEVKSKPFNANFNCKCTKKCTEILSVAERKAEFDRFWNLGSFQGRCIELQRCVKEENKKRCYASQSKTKRIYTRKYFILNKEVCKVAFLNTFGVSASRVDKALAKKRNNETKDKRGIKQGGKNAISSDKLNAIRKFISSLVNSSNYCKEDGMAYLPPNIKLPALYAMYKEQHEDVVCFSRFRRCFVNDFNLKLIATLPEVDMPVDQISDYSQDEVINNSIDSIETDDEINKAVYYLGANYDVVDTETARKIDNTIKSQSPRDISSAVIEEKSVGKALSTDVTPMDGNNCEERPKKGRAGRKRKIADQNRGITNYIQFLKERKFIV